MSELSCEIIEKCRLCDSRKLVQVLKLSDTPLANNFVRKPIDQSVYPLELMLCKSCGHLQLHHKVNRELFRTYLYASGTSSVFKRHFEGYAMEVVSRYDLHRKDFVIDIGSNDGVLLNCFQQLGMKILGVDPALDMGEAARNNYGVETLPEFWTKNTAFYVLLSDLYGRAKVITANNVFAHVDDLHEFVEAVKVALAPDGVFIFEVSYALSMMLGNLFDLIYHEHLDYHSINPLGRFFEKHGMLITHVQFVGTHGGSIRCHVQRNPDPEIGVWSSDEDEHLLHKPAKWNHLEARIKGHSRTLRFFLDDHKGSTIAIYGMPAKATTLLYAAGASQKDFDFAIDDSPWKQGLYSPGLHIPIFPPDVLETHQPEYVFIAAWNFADSIIANHPEVHEYGGKWVIPLPEWRIV